jgi:hypothetical protein
MTEAKWQNAGDVTAEGDYLGPVSKLRFGERRPIVALRLEKGERYTNWHARVDGSERPIDVSRWVRVYGPMPPDPEATEGLT